MKVRIEVSSLATSSVSGVGHYTRLLSEALSAHPEINARGVYFNFLGRQVTPSVNVSAVPIANKFIPLRVYAKLQSYNIAPPFDIFLPRVDLTIFPNFATWPTTNSRLRATTIHDLTYIRYPEAVEEKNLAHLRRVVPRSIKEADIILTVSEAVKNELVEEFSIDPSRCVATPIPPDETFSVKSSIDVHAKYNLPTKKYVYFIGNREPRKNLPVLIEAYSALPQTIKDEYSLVIAGGRGWKSEVTNKALEKARRAGDHVAPLGYIDQADSPALFQKASLFVMPSLYEGFGMPILEAMAGSCPVVAADIPVLREAGGEGALYADPQSPQEFTKAILSVLTSKNLSKELVKEGKANLQRFSWQSNAEAIYIKASELLS